MRIIDADALIDNFAELTVDLWLDSVEEAEIVSLIGNAPTIEAVPKDFHDKTCEAMAKRHTEEIRRYMWIPCSERLPEEFVYVLVCLTDGTMDVARLTDYLDIWGEPKWCRDTTHTLGGAILSSEIVAWMPLPEPWKGADDE